MPKLQNLVAKKSSLFILNLECEILDFYESKFYVLHSSGIIEIGKL